MKVTEEIQQALFVTKVSPYIVGSEEHLSSGLPVLTERESQESEDERKSEMVQSGARQDWNRNPGGLDVEREVHVIQSRRTKPSERRLTASRGQ